MNWDDYRYVQVVARAGTVRAAAELLGVNASTVVRRLEQLEQRIGQRLFARMRQGMKLTPAGEDVIATLDQVAGELARVDRALQQGGPSLVGVVSLAIAADLAAVLLVPNLGSFRALYPELELRLFTEAAEPGLGGADVALLLTNDPPAHLVGRRLGSLDATVYARTDTLERHGDDSAAYGSWLDPPAAALALANEFKAAYFGALPRGLGSDDPLLHREAIRAGAGIGLLPCAVGDNTPGLTRVPHIEARPLGDLWVLFAAHARGMARIQALVGYLQQLHREHEAALAGRKEPS